MKLIVYRIELQTPTQAHFGPDPIGGSDPDPVIGRGIGPDPDPVIGRGTGPDPVGGNGSDPDPVPVGSSEEIFENNNNFIYFVHTSTTITFRNFNFPLRCLGIHDTTPLDLHTLSSSRTLLVTRNLGLGTGALGTLAVYCTLALTLSKQDICLHWGFGHARLQGKLKMKPRLATLTLPATISPGPGMPGTIASKKSGTHWHLPSPSWLILSCTALVCSIMPMGQTATIMSGHMVSCIMGHTLVNPFPQTMDLALTGQLQAHSQLLPPSGQSQLQEHCMPSPMLGPDPDPVGGRGIGPDPDPVIGRGAGPDPDPVGGRGTGPDPEPVTGRGSGPGPDPVGGSGADPDPLGGGPDPVSSGSDPDPTGGSIVGPAST